MPVPQVAIVGRPNVGKSSLFNWLAGKRIAIVDPTSGVTRDRVTYLLEEKGRYFELTDTGGMGVDDKDGLTEDIERQIQLAIDESAVIVFVMDAQTGVTGLDEVVMKRLRGANKPIVRVANKADNPQLQYQAAADFHRFGDLIFTSVIGGRNKDELLQAIVEHLPDETDAVDPRVEIKFAVVGKRNAGKSTFINCLAQSERVIVSEVPGTTRDSVDVRFERNGRTFLAIDTAGVRKKKSLADSIEFYSFTRAQRTIRRADVVFLFIDAAVPVGTLDKQLANYVVTHYKPCVLVVNKWDLAKELTTGEYDEYLQRQFPSLDYAPRAFITAESGKNAQALLDLGQSLFNQTNNRASTSELNKYLRAAIENQRPPIRKNRRPRIFYAAQVGVAPPTLVLFCNEPKVIDATYQKYLISFMRDALPFAEVPIKMHLRKRDSHTERSEEDVDVPAVDEESPDELQQSPEKGDSDTDGDSDADEARCFHG